MTNKIKEGDIFKVLLGNNKVSFGKVLKKTWAFYDFVTDDSDSFDAKDVTSFPVVFKIWVGEFAIKKGMWPVIANLPLNEAEQAETFFYKQDPINNKVWKTSESGLEEIPVTVEECLSLELAASYDPEHVVERLEYHFSGNEDPNLAYDKKRLLEKGVSTA